MHLACWSPTAISHFGSFTTTIELRACSIVYGLVKLAYILEINAFDQKAWDYCITRDLEGIHSLILIRLSHVRTQGQTELIVQFVVSRSLFLARYRLFSQFVW